MKKIVLKFGLISGAVLATFTGILMPFFCLSEDGGLDSPVASQVVGYSAMIVAFLAIFFGIRAYRENVGGGTITFGKAFQVGILIALVASAMYVIGWEIAFWGFMPDFGDKYAAVMLKKMKADGASEAELAAETAKMAEFARLYRNPLFNVGMTFVEVFPVGLLVTLISAGILKRRPDGGEPEAVPA